LSPKAFAIWNVLVLSSQINKREMIENLAARDRLTDAAMARLLSVSKRTLLRWLKDGVIDPPALVVGKRSQRRWAEHEVAQILDHMKRGDLGDSTGDIQSAGRRGKDNHRRYFGKVLRRQRQEGAAD
jgi:DNA-binding transcriptional MerR regulator